jgi:hypothetical protein
VPRRLPTTALALAAGAVVAGCGGPHHSAAVKGAFGTYPTFLPRSTIEAGAAHRIVDATASKPALASQGDTVRVHTGGATVLATVAGPEVPNVGLSAAYTTSPATWTLTLSHATKAIPLSASAFNAVDDSGRIYRLSVVKDSTLPPSITPGQTVTTKLFATVATGEGRLRWIPTGHLAPVEWDYVVEID